MRGRYVKGRELARLEAADALAGHLVLMIGLGLFESIDLTTEEGRATRAALSDLLEPYNELFYDAVEDITATATRNVEAAQA